MKKFLSLPNQRINLNKNVNRMDPMQTYTVETTLMGNPSNSAGDFPKDFFPMLAKKYYSPPSHVYKHIYVTAPSKVTEKKKKKKKIHKKEDKEWYDAFECESDDEEYEEEEE